MVSGRSSNRFPPPARAGAGVLVAVLLSFILAPVAWGQPEPGAGRTSWWLRLSTTGYAFEDASRPGVTLDRFGAYQHVRGSVSGLLANRLSVYVGARVADDLYLADRVTTRSRLQAGYVELRPLTPLRARLGRQFVRNAAIARTIDGAHVLARSGRTVRLSGWVGVAAPADRRLDALTADEAGMFGASVHVRPARSLRVGASVGYRARDGVTAERPVGVDVSATPIARLQVRGQAVYDTELEDWRRLETQARWQPIARAPTLSLQLVDRRPMIDAASYFARFLDVEERVRQGRAALRHLHGSGLGGEVQYTGTFVDTRTTSLLGFTLLTPLGRAGYTTRFGDTGEETGFFGQLVLRPADWLRLSAGATHVTYALIEDALDSEERELITSFARAEVRLRPGLDLELEIQAAENPRYAEDVRVLAGLDVTMGRGSGRFGLDRGGFLR